MFSTRLPARLEPNALSRRLAARRDAGAPLLDLTETNPTRVGLAYPADLLAPLADIGGREYRPDPRGLRTAREAVSADYRRRGLDISPDRLVLTASTSEAYAVLFKLLCDAGDEVLVPEPSYPLFDLLTRLDVVSAVPYRLEYHGVWSIDRTSVETALTSATRALLIVSPNNPTGSMLRARDREWVADVCAEREIAIIADEVFADYPLAGRADARGIAGEARALTFALGGLSKSAGLPQVKLGWIAASGPEPLVVDALKRLEVICDTYLSVSTPVQLAAADLIESGRAIRQAIAARLNTNLAQLRASAAGFPSVSLREPEAGWSAVLEVPATRSEEELVLRLVDEADVLVHPGYFFDFAREAFVVVSLLPEPDTFADAVDRLLVIAAGGHA